MPLQYEPEDLIIKHLRNELTEEESVALEVWKQSSSKNREVFEILINEAGMMDELKLFRATGKETGFKKLLEKLQKPQKASVRKIPVWNRVAAAAIIILMFSVGGYFYFNKEGLRQVQTDNVVKNDVPAPKVTKAMITLANGQTVALDSISNGTLATQDDVKVIKNANGEIVYSGSANEVVYNTLSNPRGSKVVNLTLQDGTKVWLNAESSLRFPVAFVGSERRVEITGEAYFEVTKNASKKFLVDANGVTTEVLGTHFNVNAYVDEETLKITLLEGSVKVLKNNISIIIKPGQQARVSDAIKIASAVDTEEVMAWKNGTFSFNRTDMSSIMRQVSRWYDVEVVFKNDEVKGKDFTGTVARKENASEVLKMLEMTGAVHFTIDGRKILVRK